MARLLVHGTSYGKQTSKQLPELKILIVRESGGGSYVFSIIFIANFQGLEYILGGPAFGGEVLDVGIDGGDGSNGGTCGCGGMGGFGVSDLLGATIPFGFSLCLRRLTFICTVPLFAASEAKSFPNAISLISWRELFQVNGIHIHGIRIPGGA